MGTRWRLPEGKLTTLTPELEVAPPAILKQAAKAAHPGNSQVSSLMCEECFHPFPLQWDQQCPGVAVSVLSFDSSNWPQINGLLVDSGIMAGVHHICHTHREPRRLFNDQPGWGNLDFAIPTSANLSRTSWKSKLSWLCLGLGMVCSMTSCSKGLSHALLNASKNTATGSHGTTNEHWLSSELVINCSEGMVRREALDGSLPVY